MPIFWEKAARLITDSWIAPKNLDVYLFVFEEFRFPLALASTCYANAGRALLSATQHKKVQEKNYEWNELDDRAIELFKKALWADEGIEVEEFSLRDHAVFQERHVKLLYSQSSLLGIGRKDQVDVQKKRLYDSELKIYELYTKIAESDAEKGECAWPAEHSRQRYLMLAASQLPKTEEKYTELLLKAEAIARDIWYNYPGCLNFPEFSPEYKSQPEYTLLGQISNCAWSL